jgi:hypothetical protein
MFLSCSHNNLKILWPKVTKNLTNLHKKFCEFRPNCFTKLMKIASQIAYFASRKKKTFRRIHFRWWRESISENWKSFLSEKVKIQKTEIILKNSNSDKNSFCIKHSLTHWMTNNLWNERVLKNIYHLNKDVLTFCSTNFIH